MEVAGMTILDKSGQAATSEQGPAWHLGHGKSTSVAKGVNYNGMWSQRASQRPNFSGACGQGEGFQLYSKSDRKPTKDLKHKVT